MVQRINRIPAFLFVNRDNNHRIQQVFDNGLAFLIRPENAQAGYCAFIGIIVNIKRKAIEPYRTWLADFIFYRIDMPYSQFSQGLSIFFPADIAQHRVFEQVITQRYLLGICIAGHGYFGIANQCGNGAERIIMPHASEQKRIIQLA